MHSEAHAGMRGGAHSWAAGLGDFTLHIVHTRSDPGFQHSPPIPLFYELSSSSSAPFRFPKFEHPVDPLWTEGPRSRRSTAGSAPPPGARQACGRCCLLGAADCIHAWCPQTETDRGRDRETGLWTLLLAGRCRLNTRLVSAAKSAISRGVFG
jgi:hypothetical protein